MSRPRKAVAFAVAIAAVAASVATLSLYKVAVANAFVRLPLPAGEASAAQSWAAGLVDTPAVRARGAHLVRLVGCTDCHGADLAGQVLVDGPEELTLVAPNLTPAGPVAAFGPARWRAALRWGVDGETRALWGMPREVLLQLADDDVAALVAYLRALPPTPRSLPQSRLGWRGYVQVALRRLRLVARAPLPRRAQDAAPTHAPGAGSEAFGPYLAAVGRCTACHGPPLPGAVNVVPRMPAPALAPAARALGRDGWRERLRQGRCRSPERTAGTGGQGRLQDLSAAEAEALRRAVP